MFRRSRFPSLNHRSPLVRGLRAWYPCQTEQDIRLRDFSGHGNHIPASDFFGGFPASRPRLGRVLAVGADDSPHCFSTPHVITKPGGYPCTLATWIWLDALVSADSGILRLSLNGDVFNQITLRLDSSNRPVAEDSKASNQIRTAIAPDALVTGRWYHLAAVFTSTSKREIYVDGELRATNTQNHPAISDVDRVDFGLYKSLSDIKNVAAADITIYDRALHATEIRQLAHPGLWDLYEREESIALVSVAGTPVEKTFAVETESLAPVGRTFASELESRALEGTAGALVLDGTSQAAYYATALHGDADERLFSVGKRFVGWIKPDVLPGAGARFTIFSHDRQGSVSLIHQLFLDEDGKVGVRLHEVTTLLSSNAIAAGQWIEVELEITSENGTTWEYGVEIVLDGVTTTGILDLGSQWRDDLAHSITLGAYPTSTTETPTTFSDFFDGKLAKCLVFDTDGVTKIADWPLLGDLQDDVGTRHLTGVGSPIFDAGGDQPPGDETPVEQTFAAQLESLAAVERASETEFESLAHAERSNDSVLESLAAVERSMASEAEGLATIDRAFVLELESLALVDQTFAMEVESRGLFAVEATFASTLESLAFVEETTASGVEALTPLDETTSQEFEALTPVAVTFSAVVETMSSAEAVEAVFASLVESVGYLEVDGSVGVEALTPTETSGALEVEALTPVSETFSALLETLSELEAVEATFAALIEARGYVELSASPVLEALTLAEALHAVLLESRAEQFPVASTRGALIEALTPIEQDFLALLESRPDPNLVEVGTAERTVVFGTARDARPSFATSRTERPSFGTVREGGTPPFTTVHEDSSAFATV